MEEFRFGIASGTITCISCPEIVSQKVVVMNSGISLFRVVFDNGFDIIVKADIPKSTSGVQLPTGVNFHYKNQAVSVFSKTFNYGYKGFFEIIFRPIKYNSQMAVFNLKQNSWGQSHAMHKLELNKEGYFYAGVPLECEELRKFFTKAAVLR